MKQLLVFVFTTSRSSPVTVCLLGPTQGHKIRALSWIHGLAAVMKQCCVIILSFQLKGGPTCSEASRHDENDVLAGREAEMKRLQVIVFF